MNVTCLHVVTIAPTIKAIHSQLKDFHVFLTITISYTSWSLTRDGPYLHLIIISLLNKVRPTSTTMLIIWHFVYILNRSTFTNVLIILISHIPVINQVRSYRTCTPALTKWESICIRLTTTNTEVKSITITSSNTPTLVPVGSLVKLNSKHRLRISLIIILCPLQVLSLGIREVLYSIFIGISP